MIIMEPVHTQKYSGLDKIIFFEQVIAAALESAVKAKPAKS